MLSYHPLSSAHGSVHFPAHVQAVQEWYDADPHKAGSFSQEFLEEIGLYEQYPDLASIGADSLRKRKGTSGHNARPSDSSKKKGPKSTRKKTKKK